MANTIKNPEYLQTQQQVEELSKAAGAGNQTARKSLDEALAMAKQIEELDKEYAAIVAKLATTPVLDDEGNAISNNYIYSDADKARLEDLQKRAAALEDDFVKRGGATHVAYINEKAQSKDSLLPAIAVHTKDFLRTLNDNNVFNIGELAKKVCQQYPAKYGDPAVFAKNILSAVYKDKQDQLPADMEKISAAQALINKKLKDGKPLTLSSLNKAEIKILSDGYEVMSHIVSAMSNKVVVLDGQKTVMAVEVAKNNLSELFGMVPALQNQPKELDDLVKAHLKENRKLGTKGNKLDAMRAIELDLVAAADSRELRGKAAALELQCATAAYAAGKVAGDALTHRVESVVNPADEKGQELDDLMKIAEEAEKYAKDHPSSMTDDELFAELEENTEAKHLSGLLHNLEEQEANTDKDNARFSASMNEWFKNFDVAKLDKLCEELGFPKAEFPGLHFVLNSHGTAIRDYLKEHPMTMADFKQHLSDITAEPKTDVAEYVIDRLARCLGKIGIVNLPDEQFGLLYDANPDRKQSNQATIAAPTPSAEGIKSDPKLQALTEARIAAEAKAKAKAKAAWDAVKAADAQVKATDARRAEQTAARQAAAAEKAKAAEPAPKAVQQKQKGRFAQWLEKMKSKSDHGSKDPTKKAKRRVDPYETISPKELLETQKYLKKALENKGNPPVMEDHLKKAESALESARETLKVMGKTFDKDTVVKTKEAIAAFDGLINKARATLTNASPSHANPLYKDSNTQGTMPDPDAKPRTPRR